MAGLGDYSKKAKGSRGYKMKGPSLLKMVEKEKRHFLERDNAGPIATEKPTGPGSKDWEEREKEDRTLHNMEQVEKISDLVAPDMIKKKKKYPKSYTKEDIKFLEEQREDVVREEDKK